jgi:hypothetical protein
VSDLTRVTVNLAPPSKAALASVMSRSGLPQTDCVNRALTLLDWVSGRQEEGAKLLARYPDGSEERVVFL